MKLKFIPVFLHSNQIAIPTFKIQLLFIRGNVVLLKQKQVNG